VRENTASREFLNPEGNKFNALKGFVYVGASESRKDGQHGWPRISSSEV
jgi:hypothetical protein